MNSPNNQSALSTDKAIEEVVLAATARASESMSFWTNGYVSLEVGGVLNVPIENLDKVVSFREDAQAMVLFDIDGDENGRLILFFEEQEGRRLASMLAKREFDNAGEWSEFEVSAIQETGNILGSAYLCELSRQLSIAVQPSPPMFIRDFGMSVVEQAIMASVHLTDSVSLCQTKFCFDQEHLDWAMLLLPGSSLRPLLNAK